MLALIGSKEAGLPGVDYSLSVPEVYTRTAAHYYWNASSLSLSMSCELAPDRMPDLPSWVPDWSTSSTARRHFPYRFSATHTVPQVEFRTEAEGRVLRLPGVVKNISKVKVVEVMGLSRIEATEAILRILRIIPAADGEYVGGNAYIIEALWCALHIGQFQHTTTPVKISGTALEETRRISRYLLSLVSTASKGTPSDGTSRSGSISSGENALYGSILDHAVGLCEGRVLFLTEDGFVGLGPLSASPGDTLFFPWGSRFPVLMRPATTTGELRKEEGQQKWLVVGPCYVSGLMSGGILYGPLPPGYCLVRHTPNEGGGYRREIHKMVIQDDRVVSSEWDAEYERQRVTKTFGVDNPRSVTPEMALNKGIPITWVDFV
ncbi:hypothetical protein PG994_005027 [Apiospora phragmitis]|uniref:Uncharacterized protein n=1 Tax=Apiospora phragmitis TaxID=2905665 RepID=A0ABR1VS85_9PEZI